MPHVSWHSFSCCKYLTRKAGRGADTRLSWPRSGTVQPVLPSPSSCSACSPHCTCPPVGQARAGEPCAAAPRPEAALAARRAALAQNRMNPEPLSAPASQQHRQQQHPRLRQQATRRRARRAATPAAASPSVHLPTLCAGYTAAPSTCLAGESCTCPGVGCTSSSSRACTCVLVRTKLQAVGQTPNCWLSQHTLPADSCTMRADRSCTSR